MPAKNPRLNVVLDPAILSSLADLAKKQAKSLSEVAKDLIMNALDRHEDLALSRLAAAREELSEKNKEPRVSHEKAWK